MLNRLLTSIFGSRNDRLIKQLSGIVKKINAFEAQMEALSDAELQAKISEIEERKKRREVMQSPLLKDFDKFKKQAAKFTQACMDEGRKDVANSMMALMATMERQIKQT